MKDEIWDKLIKSDPACGIDPYKEDNEPAIVNKDPNSDLDEILKKVQRLHEESIVKDLINYTQKPKIEVKIVSDGDHNYIIPAGMMEEFYRMLDSAENDYFVEFNAVFSEYRKNPDDLKLYTDEI